MFSGSVVRRIFTMGSGLVGLSLFAGFAVAFDRDPVGERTEFLLDRSSARTSSLVQEGSFATYVTQALPDHQNGPAYETKLDYDIRVRFAGRQRGSYAIALPVSYFTPEFFEQLRESGHFETSQFKVQHLGFANATTVDGAVYENCDKIRLYDIQDIESLPFAQAARDILQAAAGDLPIEDLELVAHVKEGEPVLGAVKLDLTATYSGMPIKLGADYQR